MSNHTKPSFINPDERYLSDRQIAKRFDIHRTSPWKWAAQGKFPQPVRLSERVTRWRLSDVLAWEKGAYHE